MIEILDAALSGMSVGRLAELGLAGFAVLSLVSLALVVISARASAAQRHAVLNAALCALLVLPFLEITLPRWEALPAIPGAPSPTDAMVVTFPAYGLGQAARPTAQQPVGGKSDPSTLGLATAGPEESPIVVLEAKGGAVPSASPAESRLRDTTMVRVAVPWLPLLAALWLFGAMVVLAGLGVGLAARAVHFRRGWANVVEREWLDAFELAKTQIPVRRPVRLRWGCQARVPVTWGAFRPVIVLPVAAKAWGPQQRRAALLHELAHVARGDHASQSLAQVACALHWFNPLAWWASRRLREEAEQASDDRAAQLVQSPTDYAFELVRVARLLKGQRMRFVAGVAMARSSDLESRIDAILDPNRRRTPVTPRLTLAVVAGALLLTAPLAALSQQQVDQSAGPDPAELTEAAQSAGVDAAWTDRAEDRPQPTEPPPSQEPDAAEGTSAYVESASWPPSDLMSQEAPCIPGASGNRSITENISGRNGRTEVRWETQRCTILIELEGVEFTPDEQAIGRIEAGGRFTLKQEGLGPDRELRARPTSGGIEYDYRVEGAPEVFGPEAQAWLATLIPTVFRVTGLQMAERLARLLDEGGADAVFAEVQLIYSDHVAAGYLGTLMDSTDLTDSQTATLFAVARDQIESDHELGQLLRRAWKSDLSAAARREYVDAAGTLDSDHELAQVIRILFDGPLNRADAGAILELARNVESDHELAAILIALQESVGFAALEPEAFFEVVGALQSDHELGRVLTLATESGELSPLETAAILTLSYGLESDHELGGVLKALVTSTDLDADVVLGVLDAADRLAGDYERAELLRRVLDRQWPFTESVQRRFIESAESIDSDYERDRTLAELARRATR